MQTPAIIYLGLNLFALGIILSKHGETITVNFWTKSLSWLLITVPLLYWGGFFSGGN